MHNDEPTLRDILDRKALVEEVGEAIATCTPPQVFGIHGDWGLGKTSFLHQVQWYLTGSCPQQSEAQIKEAGRSEKGKYVETVQAVWFDAWRYQHEEVPIVALLQEMRAQLSWGHQIRKSITRSAEVNARGALLSIEGVTKKIGFQYSKFRDASREWETENLAAALPSHTLREHLREAIGQLLPRKKRNAPLSPRLAVFIDDIDRCEPEVAYRLLEGLKIYLTLDNCVFILGMNQKAIEDAIGSQMGATTGSPKSRAAAYMEKLCQNVWQLPAIRNPGEVLHSLLEQTVESERVRTWIREAVGRFSCLPPNPRRLKGLANMIGRLAPRLPPESVLTAETAIIEARILMIVASIYQFHPELYIRWEADLDFYKRIFDRCNSDESNIPVLQSLVLPEQGSETGTEPTPGNERESTYPDPTATNVFWIQPLILELGTEVPPGQFELYLRDRAE